ncbi:MAG: hypothetical protein LKCHEGNO_00065 [Burkholderiaceae bacterium]|nr:hypothetical protein [Burkholderiaceae bacterium]
MATVMATSQGKGQVPATTLPKNRCDASVGLAERARCLVSLTALAAATIPAFGQQAPGGVGPLPGEPPPNDARQPPNDGAAARANQPGGASQPPILVIGAAVLLTATDNADLTPQPRSDYLAEGRLNLRLNLPYRRLRGYFDYTLAAVHFGRSSESDEILNALESELTAEVIEQHGFVEAAASVGQQLRSAFGAATLSQGVSNETTTLSPTAANPNRIESATYRVAPYLRARLGESGQFEARAEQSETRFRGLDGNDFSTQRARLLADGGVRPRALRWRTQFDAAIYDFDSGRRTHEAMLRGDLGWAFDEEKVVSLIAGREGNNFQTAQRRYGTIYGASLDWRPSERTQFYAEGLHRFFGMGHTVTFSHRESRMAITVSDSRTVVAPDRLSAGGLAPAYDVLFLQFAGAEPDPVRRRALVQDTLLRNGIDPTEQIVSDFLTNGAMIVSRQTVALSWTHARDLVTLGLERVENRRADTLVQLPSTDSFAATDRVDQTGGILTWAHRLTPTATLTLAGTVQRTTGELSSQATTLHSVSILWSSRLSETTTLALSGRHDRFASDSSPYRVNTVTASIRTQF